MGRLLGFRKVRSPLRAVEEAIAALHEELAFSLNYAHAMVRDENYRAAAEVIEEQRRSLIRTSEALEEALRRPERDRNRHRVQAALAGLAAAVLVGSGAFAAWGPQAPPSSGRVQAIQQASEALSRASAISDPQALTTLVGAAQDAVLTVAETASADPAVKRSLLEFVQKQTEVLQQNNHIPALIRAKAEVVENKIKDVVEVPASTTTSTSTSTAPASSTTTGTAPSPNASV